MVFIVKDNGAFSYRIQEMKDGIIRILDNGGGFESMGEALTYVERMKKAIASNGLVVVRDPEMKTFGYQIVEPETKKVLTEELGWITLEDVEVHIASIKEAIVAGTKTLL